MIGLPPLRAELFRLLRVRGNQVLLLSPAAVAWVHLWVRASATRRDVAAAALAAGPDAPPPSGFGPLADGLHTGGVALTVVLLVLGALSLARERESGALGAWFLARGRGAVVLAKAGALVLAGAAGFGVLFAACYAFARWRYGLGPIVEEGYELATRAELWAEIRRGTLPALPGILAAPLFGLFVSSLLSSTGAAVAATLVPFVAMDLLKELLGDGARYAFVTYAPLIGGGSPLAKLPDMARFYADQQWREGELFLATWVPSAWCVAWVVAAMWVTRRRSA